MGPIASPTKWAKMPFCPTWGELAKSKASIKLLWEPCRGCLLNRKGFLLTKWRGKHLWTGDYILFSFYLQKMMLSSNLNFIKVFTECAASH